MKRSSSILFGFLCLFVLSGCGTTLSKTIRNYGYTDLQPPMNLTPPGTIIEIQNDTLEGIVCTQTASLGAAFEVPESATYNIDLMQAINKTFSISADYLKQIQAAGGFSAIKKIYLTLSNAKVSQLSADTVFANVIYRSPECQKAIDEYVKNARKVTMVTSVLIADVVYRVEFESSAKLDASAEADILRRLAPKLGLSYSSSGSEKLEGQGLFWGIKEESLLVKITFNRKVLEHVSAGGAVAGGSATIDFVTNPANRVQLLSPKAPLKVLPGSIKVEVK